MGPLTERHTRTYSSCPQKKRNNGGYKTAQRALSCRSMTDVSQPIGGTHGLDGEDDTARRAPDDRVGSEQAGGGGAGDGGVYAGARGGVPRVQDGYALYWYGDPA